MIGKLRKNLNSSVGKKMTVVMILAVAVPTALVILFASSRFSQESIRNYIVSTSYIVDNTASRLDDYIKQLDTLSLFAFYNERSGELNEYEMYDNTLLRLLHIYSQRSEIHSLLYYFPHKEELFVVNDYGNRSFLEAADIEEFEWYQNVTTAKSHYSRYVLRPYHFMEGYSSRYQIDDDTAVFSLDRMFISVTGEKSILSLNCKLNYIADICSNAVIYDQEFIEYMNPAGEVIYSSDLAFDKEENLSILDTIKAQDHQQKSVSYVTAGGEELTVVYRISEDTGNILIKLIPSKVLTSYTETIGRMGVLILLVAILIIIPMGALLARQMTQPLLNMERLMAKVGQGDLSVIVPVRSTDEIGRISQSFNDMTRRLDTLVTEQYKMQLAYRTSQLYSLIAQINPHFINNTLQSIGGVALEKGAREIYSITNALGKMLRYSINKDSIVTLQEEEENIKDYMYIQKFRYEDKLTYSLEIPAEIRSARVPRLLLQPLVENAVIHGIEKKKKTGHITIKASREDAHISIRITDDGIGMSLEQLNRIRERFRKNEKEILIESESIGIINVYQRLCLMYDKNFFMNIDSEEGKGTEILVRIPSQTGYEEEI